MRSRIVFMLVSVAAVARADATTPPSTDASSSSTIELPTKWPRSLPCRPTRLFLQSFDKVDVEWRGRTGQALRFELRNVPNMGWEGRGSGPIADVPVGADFPIGKLDTLRVRYLEKKRSGSGPYVALHCGGEYLDIGSGGVTWNWLSDSGEVAVERTIARRFPVGESYFGRGGWDCLGDCKADKSLARLVETEPATLAAQNKADLIALGRDLIAEATAVMIEACGDSCSARAKKALATARSFAASPPSLSGVTSAGSGDSRWKWKATIRGGGDLRLVVACGPLPRPRTLDDHCTAFLYRRGVLVLRYHAGRETGISERFRQGVALGGDGDEGGVSIMSGQLGSTWVGGNALAVK
jgi:hypothetical protein